MRCGRCAVKVHGRCRGGVSPPTAAKAIQGLQEAGVLQETTGRLRNQSFLYTRYVELLKQ